ncbi:MAG: protein translocase subunit SecF [Candidatus Limnocylindrales bacterium]
MFDLIGKRRWFFLFSGIITIPGLIFTLLTPFSGGKAGLDFSIDFTGGTIWEIRFANGTPDAAAVKDVLAGQGITDATVAITTRPTGEYVLLRMPPIGLLEAPTVSPSPIPTISPSPGPSASPGPSGSAAAPSPSPSPSPAPSATPAATPAPSATPTNAGIALPTTGQGGGIVTALKAAFGPIADVSQATVVGPVVSRDLINQALLLILFGSLGILIWITVRFHDVRMGATALVALLHDVIVVVGVFAILGTFFRVQIDALFVTAMLTVIGFSVHDTIVVYDRIRENRFRHAGEPFSAIVNHSLLQTLGRSINTSMTVVLTLTALLLFGGEAIRVFVLALLIGIVSGTYSSIFNASPLLVVWHERDERQRQAQLTAARAGR